MANKVIASISLPAEVLRKAEKLAKETHKSRSGLIKEAVLEYLDQHEIRKAQEEAAPYALANGIQTEKDVEKLLREIRKSNRDKRSALDEARRQFKKKGFDEDTIASAVRWVRKNKN